MTREKKAGAATIHPPIPARPYLGLSVENATEIEDVVLVRVEEVLR